MRLAVFVIKLLEQARRIEYAFGRFVQKVRQLF
jgi:hypothetical protein